MGTEIATGGELRVGSLKERERGRARADAWGGDEQTPLAPVSGKVEEINGELEQSPETLNKDAENDGE